MDILFQSLREMRARSAVPPVATAAESESDEQSGTDCSGPGREVCRPGDMRQRQANAEQIDTLLRSLREAKARRGSAFRDDEAEGEDDGEDGSEQRRLNLEGALGVDVRSRAAPPPGEADSERTVAVFRSARGVKVLHRRAPGEAVDAEPMEPSAAGVAATATSRAPPELRACCEQMEVLFRSLLEVEEMNATMGSAARL